MGIDSTAVKDLVARARREVDDGYLTNRHDRHVLRQWRRTAGIASRGAVCATPN